MTLINSIKFQDEMYKRFKTTDPDQEMHTILENNLRDDNPILQRNINEAKWCIQY